jgi:hypothetical protein
MAQTCPFLYRSVPVLKHSTVANMSYLNERAGVCCVGSRINETTSMNSPLPVQYVDSDSVERGESIQLMWSTESA